MTDEQIIKALEICSDKLIISCPDDCPFYDECEEDLYVLKRQALDLITRQKAEIERLQKKIDYLKDMNKKNDAHLHVRLIEQAKSEAYKEFAERLRQNCEKYPYTLPSVLANIEITYKELTEGGNEDGMD